MIKTDSKGILPHAMEIPRKVKANCYAFALAPPVGKGGYTIRRSKSIPGDKDLCYRDKSIVFSESGIEEFNKRVIADNPKYVHLIKDRYKKTNNHVLEQSYKDLHFMVAMLSPSTNKTHSDFHFVRRIDLIDIITDNSSTRSFLKIIYNSSDKCLKQLRKKLVILESIITSKSNIKCKRMFSENISKILNHINNFSDPINKLNNRRPLVPFFHNINENCDKVLKNNTSYQQNRFIWIHQRGWSSGGPLIHDANGDLIVNIKKANFNYTYNSGVDYKIDCGLFLIKTRYATVNSRFDLNQNINNSVYHKKLKEPNKMYYI